MRPEKQDLAAGFILLRSRVSMLRAQYLMEETQATLRSSRDAILSSFALIRRTDELIGKLYQDPSRGRSSGSDGTLIR